jgi:site-specific recombinase XerD
MQNIFPNK